MSIRLADMGGDVLVVDNMLPRQGGNFFNIEPVKNKGMVNISDIKNVTSMNHLVKGVDYVFQMARQVNHIDNVKNPLNDLSIYVECSLVIMEALRMYNPEAKVIFTGTRGIYCALLKLPVAQSHAINPISIYTFTNLVAERIVLTYHNLHKIKSICLRIKNTYVPRHHMMHDEYGVFNWFIRKVIDNEVIHIFSKSSILRDYLYIDYLVDSLINIMQNDNVYNEIYNVGSGIPLSFFDLAKKIVNIAGYEKFYFTGFTEERNTLGPGDYNADITKINKVTGSEPKTGLDEDFKKTLVCYKTYKKYYWQN